MTGVQTCALPIYWDIVWTHRIGVDILDPNTYVIVSTGDEETEISSSGCSQPQASYEADDNKRDFKVKHKIVDKDVVVMDPEGDEYIEPRTPPGMEEPVTMKSEVDAIEHDKAVE